MTAAEILERLTDLGVTVEAVGKKLRLTPGSLLPSALVSEVRSHTDELVGLLGYRPPWMPLLHGTPWRWLVRLNTKVFAYSGPLRSKR